LVLHGFDFDLIRKLRAESEFVSLRETGAKGAKNPNRFDFLGFDLYPMDEQFITTQSLRSMNAPFVF
jgi:hypothetical protein